MTEHIFTLWTGTDDAGRPRPSLEPVLRAMDDQADMKNVLSLEVSACWIDEPQGGLALREDAGATVDPGLREELFQELVGRVGRGPETPRHWGLIWLTGNPPAPTHWVARLFHYDGRGAPANPDPDRHLFLTTRETNARAPAARLLRTARAGHGHWHADGAPLRRRRVDPLRLPPIRPGRKGRPRPGMCRALAARWLLSGCPAATKSSLSLSAWHRRFYIALSLHSRISYIT
jgi:hypothetical protein